MFSPFCNASVLRGRLQGEVARMATMSGVVIHHSICVHDESYTADEVSLVAPTSTILRLSMLNLRP